MRDYEGVRRELPRIIDFIRGYVMSGETVIIPVSGGLDSDVTARLCAEAVGSGNVHLFAVKQSGMEEKYFRNIENLAADIHSTLALIGLDDMNVRLIDALSEADSRINFDKEYILDSARAYCSLRTAIISCYQDKGCVIAGCTNRTERELGFFLPFGDNLGHFKPIAHLYKTEVRILASILHTRPEVISQPPSAAFWEGENDLEDIAYWLYNKGPVMCGRVFSDDDDKAVAKINAGLSQERIDLALEAFSSGKTVREAAEHSGLSLSTAELLSETLRASGKIKNRKLLVSME
ncbi:MAG: NAD(+) synthase [Synergistaceae bacterium]|nr:NAD(+) synthase [Synergistaceae bacterium]